MHEAADRAKPLACTPCLCLGGSASVQVWCTGRAQQCAPGHAVHTRSPRAGVPAGGAQVCGAAQGRRPRALFPRHGVPGQGWCGRRRGRPGLGVHRRVRGPHAGLHRALRRIRAGRAAGAPARLGARLGVLRAVRAPAGPAGGPCSVARAPSDSSGSHLHALQLAHALRSAPKTELVGGWSARPGSLWPTACMPRRCPWPCR